MINKLNYLSYIIFNNLRCEGKDDLVENGKGRLDYLHILDGINTAAYIKKFPPLHFLDY